MTAFIISIPTFNRPAGIMRTLDGVAKLQLPAGLTLEVLVVDNSVEANAIASVTARADGFPFNLTAIHEPKRGLTAVRNRCLQEADVRNADYLAFIDDDEWPEEQWIAELYKAIEATDAVLICGTVIACYDLPPPWWATAGGFYNVEVSDEITIVRRGSSGNLLIDLQAVKALGIVFDERFSFTGGEDSKFFEDVCQAGKHIFFSPQAIVYESVSAERMQKKWLLNRWIRTGTIDSRIETLGAGKLSLVRLRALATGIARLVLGSLGAVLSAPLMLFKSAYAPRCIRVACRGIGYCLTILDIKMIGYGKKST